MANKVEISTLLKRNLKAGKEFDVLIPRVKCERTNLGEGDTFNTVDWMKDWIEKYSYQTAKISPKLQGRSLEETVNNIYQFLYDHVQYTADGALQQLRSPACTWAQRKEGVDCKSYSVFASSILSNLGIKHFIRQVRQPYFFPDEFTHVYVVVPRDQNVTNYSENVPTLVLDATKHQNTEGSFIEKVDLQMTNLKHVGLNAPLDERTQKIIENFEKFSNFLLVNGASLSTVNAMRTEVNKSTSIGVDPKFKVIDQGILIDGKLFPLRLVQEKYTEGLGIEPMTTMATASAIMKMLPEGFIDDTFGAVFANGFNLSCWNSSSSPQESQKIISTSIMPFFEDCIQKISNPSSNSELLRHFNLALEGSYKLAELYGDMAKNTKWAKCTIDGHKVIAEFAEGIRSQFDALLNSSQFSITKTMVNGKAVFVFPAALATDKKEFKLGHGGAANFPVSYPKITSISSKGGNVNTGGSTGGNTGGSTGGNNYQPTTDTENLNTSGGGKDNTPLIIGGVALATIPLLFMMKSKGKGSPAEAIRTSTVKKAPAKTTKKASK